MDERQIGLALALNELGVSSDVSEFDSRLILQKIVYLIEEAGIKLGYGFNWYLRGPYSPVLTRDLFDLASTKEDTAGWVLDSQSKAIASRLKPLLNNSSHSDGSSQSRRLELLASLHFLANRGRINVHDHLEATSQLKQNGKVFRSEEVETAIQELKQFGLL